MQEFCLPRVILLFAVCGSFVCSVLEFCLQRVILLFAECWSFVCSMRVYGLQRVILLLEVCMYFFSQFRVIYLSNEFFYLQCFLFVKAVSPMGHCTNMTSNFDDFVVGSLKSEEELAVLYSCIFFAKIKEFFPPVYTRELLCFGNSAELATFSHPTEIESGRTGMVYR